MQKIVPHLWYDRNGAEAAAFYVSVFPDSSMGNVASLEDTPSGNVTTVSIKLSGLEFILLAAGPEFKFNPSASFLVACDTPAEVDRLWSRLREGGGDLMPLGSYPFSERFGWLQDRFGLSWQIMYQPRRSGGPTITPTLMFTKGNCGQAEEALRFWSSIFRDARVGEILHYGKDEEPDREGTVKHGAFILEGQEFAAMDSAYAHDFAFNEAVSFLVRCDSQEELDYYWKRLSAVPEAEQCGWLKDRYGVSWQIVPRVLAAMIGDKDARRSERVTRALLEMKKLNFEALRKAYEG